MQSNKPTSYRLPPDLVRLVEDEAIEEGRSRAGGRRYNPSKVVERIVRAHFVAKQRGEAR